ncbi:unnamed protein product [Amoebophrya sp. A120]|nr:unnamed protein product [Amoebophrya sp. A120]|eukprot:GSA120T00007576001.1
MMTKRRKCQRVSAVFFKLLERQNRHNDASLLILCMTEQQQLENKFISLSLASFPAEAVLARTTKFDMQHISARRNGRRRRSLLHVSAWGQGSSYSGMKNVEDHTSTAAPSPACERINSEVPVGSETDDTTGEDERLKLIFGKIKRVSTSTLRR